MFVVRYVRMVCSGRGIGEGNPAGPLGGQRVDVLQAVVESPG